MLALEIIERLQQSDRSKATPDYFEFPDGTILWSASLVLLNWLAQNGSLRGRRVLELGSGLGHLAVGLSSIGAELTCTERPRELRELKASVTRQLAERSQLQAEKRVADGSQDTAEKGMAVEADGSLEAVELEWGEEAFSRSPLSQAGSPAFDALILAEVVYNTSYHEALLWTIRKFSHPGIVIYSVMVDRPFSFMFFAQLHDLGCFDVMPITEFDSLGMDRDIVHMHQITMRKPL